MGCLPEGARDAYGSHNNAQDQTVVRLFTTWSLHLRQMNCAVKLHGMSKVTIFLDLVFICTSVLPACTSVHYVYTRMVPAAEIKSPGTGVTGKL